MTLEDNIYELSKQLYAHWVVLQAIADKLGIEWKFNERGGIEIIKPEEGEKRK